MPSVFCVPVFSSACSAACLATLSAAQGFWTQPWTELTRTDSFWMLIMGFWVCAACSLVGNFLVLRRMALVGDALSHAVFPGMVLAFLLCQSRSTAVMFTGATLAAWGSTALIDLIGRCTRLKPDTVLGIVFASLFALGVVLVSLFADKVDLDPDCVLYGELAFIAYQEPWLLPLSGGVTIPMPVVRMVGVTLLAAGVLGVFYKAWLLTSFDPALAQGLGFRPRLFHFLLIALAALVIVSSFEAVGAILVVAMLIFPAVTAAFWTQRLPALLGWGIGLAFVYTLLGIHLSFWLNCSVGGAIVAVALGVFLAAWLGAQALRWGRRCLQRLGPQAWG
jgi:manganese/zinc/iron transport system permease protein